MGDVAVHVEELGKLYRIGRPKEAYGTLRDTLVSAVTSPVRALRGQRHRRGDEFWALRDVSFDVKHGEVLGVIGRNGAGKSTLLKILSRITEPTTGWAEIHGRVGSLLEVGTGFHPELTGRENIYLNGAILGMTRRDIDLRFDEIVEFAEIQQFLDTPVKRYSSGMYTRLAFSVAAHLEPEILIVDEVLSVGDAAFQQKSVGRISAVAQQGRTVLFVSHNMTAVQTLCDTSILLDGGIIEYMGSTLDVIRRYHQRRERVDHDLLPGAHGVQMLAARLRSDDDSTHFTPDRSLTASADFYTDRNLPRSYLNFVIQDASGQYVFHSRSDEVGEFPSFQPGLHNVTIKLTRLCLAPGIYSAWFRLYVNSRDVEVVTDSDRIALDVQGLPIGGLLRIPCDWSWT